MQHLDLVANEEIRNDSTAQEPAGGRPYHIDDISRDEPFIEQVTMFPNAGHDDMADAMSQASAWLLQHRRRGWMVTDAFTGRVIDDFTY